MSTKKNQKKTKSGSTPGTSRSASTKAGKNVSKWGNAPRWLIYGGLTTAALFGVARVPYVRTILLPLVGTAVAKNWGTIRTALQRA